MSSELRGSERVPTSCGSERTCGVDSQRITAQALARGPRDSRMLGHDFQGSPEAKNSIVPDALSFHRCIDTGEGSADKNIRPAEVSLRPSQAHTFAISCNRSNEVPRPDVSLPQQIKGASKPAVALCDSSDEDLVPQPCLRTHHRGGSHIAIDKGGDFETAEDRVGQPYSRIHHKGGDHVSKFKRDASEKQGGEDTTRKLLNICWDSVDDSSAPWIKVAKDLHARSYDDQTSNEAAGNDASSNSRTDMSACNDSPEMKDPLIWNETVQCGSGSDSGTNQFDVTESVLCKHQATGCDDIVRDATTNLEGGSGTLKPGGDRKTQLGDVVDSVLQVCKYQVMEQEVDGSIGVTAPKGRYALKPERDQMKQQDDVDGSVLYKHRAVERGVDEGTQASVVKENNSLKRKGDATSRDHVGGTCEMQPPRSRVGGCRPPKRRSGKYKKHPDAPKHPKSAFKLFFSEAAKGGKLKHIQGAGCGSNLKRAGDMWKALENEERKKWEDAAAEDRERYKEEKADYKGPWRIEKDYGKDMTPENPYPPHVPSEDCRLPKKRSGTHKKHPDAPKRHKSAFWLFFSEAMKDGKPGSFRGAGSGAPVKRAGEMWKALENEERKKWEDEAAKDRERYEEEKADYKGPWSIEKDEEPVMAPKDNKRPKSAFWHFARKRHSEVKARRPDFSPLQIATALHYMWEKSPGSEREEYLVLERKDLDQHSNTMTECCEQQTESTEVQVQVKRSENHETCRGENHSFTGSSQRGANWMHSSSVRHHQTSASPIQHCHVPLGNALKPVRQISAPQFRHHFQPPSFSPLSSQQVPQYAQNKSVALLQSARDYNMSLTAGMHSSTISRAPSSFHAPFDRVLFTNSQLASKRDNQTPNRSLIDGLKYGRVRRYDSSKGAYGTWEDLIAPRNHSSCGDGVTLDGSCIRLRRGGILRYVPSLLPCSRRESIAKIMRSSKLYRQYKFGPGGLSNEPRVHVLLSSNAATLGNDQHQPCSLSTDSRNSAGPGYVYHGIKMKALPLNSIPEVAELSTELATLYRLPRNEWSIGVDLIVYRNGMDGIGWHSDDTQSEDLVLCIVAESEGAPRPLRIRPKKKAMPLQDGDEEIELCIRQGDGYEMNGEMQVGYEHSLPKDKKLNSLRSALIFRQGRVVSIPRDTGHSIADQRRMASEGFVGDDGDIDVLTPPEPPPSVAFGHPSPLVEEGSKTYSRGHLYTTCAHRLDQRGVNGNRFDGCDSIVVSRQNPMLREDDGLEWLKYTSSSSQGGGALATSFQKGKVIRVFRSSSLNGPYAPPMRSLHRTAYRYDGLYKIECIWDEEGETTRNPPQTNGAQHTFLLVRCPSKDACEGRTSGEEYYNNLSTQGLWDEIMKSHGYEPNPFKPVERRLQLQKLPNESILSRKRAPEMSCEQEGIISHPSRPPPVAQPTPRGILATNVSEQSSELISCALRTYAQSVGCTTPPHDVTHQAEGSTIMPATNIEPRTGRGIEIAPSASDAVHVPIAVDLPTSQAKKESRITKQTKQSHSKVCAAKHNIGHYTSLPNKDHPKVPSSSNEANVVPAQVNLPTAPSASDSAHLPIDLPTVQDKRTAQTKKESKVNKRKKTCTSKRNIAGQFTPLPTNDQPKKGRCSNATSPSSSDSKFSSSNNEASIIPTRVQQLDLATAGYKRKTKANNEPKTTSKRRKKEQFTIGHELYCKDRGALYEAKIIKSRLNEEDGLEEYRVHYKGFKKCNDEWVARSRLFERTPANKKRFEAARHSLDITKKAQKRR